MSSKISFGFTKIQSSQVTNIKGHRWCKFQLYAMSLLIDLGRGCTPLLNPPLFIWKSKVQERSKYSLYVVVKIKGKKNEEVTGEVFSLNS